MRADFWVSLFASVWIGLIAQLAFGITWRQGVSCAAIALTFFVTVSGIVNMEVRTGGR